MDGTVPKVHPRVCGGSQSGQHRRDDQHGASPRVRGKPEGAHLHQVHAGCIPACAGEASFATGRSFCTRVHPRVCGGSRSFRRSRYSGSGASPRVRGKLPAVRVRPGVVGCIPACAGEAGAPESSSRRLQVHPRVCGGSCLASAAAVVATGASPRVRGKPGGSAAYPRASRCIPACAGEAEGSRSYRITLGVHPRVCGGSRARLPVPREPPGASPRVRGKLRHARRAAAVPGCIPACAGEAWAARHSGVFRRVHPRVCGGSDHLAALLHFRRGASPRVRGKPFKLRHRSTPSRCIPACAGEAGSARTGARIGWVHPRVCGGSWPTTPRPC